MTPEEFLSARIAEDEANPACEGYDEYNSCHDWTKRRVAECKAKGELIKISEFCAADTSAKIVRALARPYADHPDYAKVQW